ncbi:uncharacterized protein LOC143912448 [Arctopsyche grandis]|uniref:uncharacterized protein LOC143912448 n=1 Tax=Arctopsyche grandis TaxID=121162 RepID=UPI00406D801B
MRTKTFLILSVLVTGLLLIIINSQRPDSLQHIVTQTHQQIRYFQENLKEAEEKHLQADEKYLNLLGLVGKTEEWHNTSVPAIVSYVFDGQYVQAIGLVRNIGSKLPNHTLILYDLGLSKYSLNKVQTYCNSSKCMIINFDLSVFPSHVSEERLHAYRPLIIQDALSKVGAIVFLECDQRFIGEPAKINELHRAAADGIGIIAWATRPAVSSLTHPKMFEYFHTDADNFLFLPMVKVIQLVIVRSNVITKYIMLPWVQCALTQDCIFPIGAQSEGCRFDKKPQYRYSGCHSYDSSALNIVLGLRYNLDESQYTYRGANVFFKKTANDRAYDEYSQLEKNSTYVMSDVTDENSSNKGEQTDVSQ